MKNRRGKYTKCRLHGGRSAGPTSAAGLERSRRANWKDGYYSREALDQRRAERQEIRSLIRELRQAANLLLRGDAPRLA